MNITSKNPYVNAMIATPIIASLTFLSPKFNQDSKNAIDTKNDTETFYNKQEAESNYQKAMMLIREQEIKDSINLEYNMDFEDVENVTKYKTVKELREQIECSVSIGDYIELN